MSSTVIQILRDTYSSAMNPCLCQNRTAKWIWLAFAGAMFGCVLAFALHRTGKSPDDTVTTAMRRLETVWLSIPNRHQGKTEYSDACGVLSRALEQCSPEEQHSIVRWMISPGIDPDTNKLDNGFLGALDFLVVQRLIGNRDREQLLLIFRHVPVDDVGFVPVETALGYDFTPIYGEKDPWKPDDLITVLFDAYDQAATPEARKSMLAAIQRSFKDQPGDPEQGAAYVAQCRLWFKQNFTKLEAMKDHIYVESHASWKQVKPLYTIRKSNGDN